MNYDQKCQLLIIGDSTVGKTSIITRFANGTFDSNYLATVGLDNFTKDEIIDNKTIRIKIWDTAGQERYKSLTKGFFRNAEGVMLVYDVTNSETYENLKYWMQSIKNNLGENMGEIPIIIIGNKIDCQEREVSVEEAENFWKEQGFPKSSIDPSSCTLRPVSGSGKAAKDPHCSCDRTHGSRDCGYHRHSALAK